MNLLLTAGRSLCFVACFGAAAQEGPVPERDLQLWKDPAFQRRFVDSYLSETEVEPRLDDDDRDQMRKVMDLLAAGKSAEAAQFVDGLRGAAQNAVFDFTRANLHFQKDEFDQAAAAYAIAVEKWPRFRRAWKNLGLIQVRRSEFDKAVTSFARVAELGGGDAATHGLLGYAHAAGGDPLAAETAYRLACLLDPKAMDWRMGLARCLFQQKRHADAVALLGPMIAANPERADLWLLQANALAGMDQPRRAAENLEMVDKLDQSTAESLALLADIYCNSDLPDLAVAAYERALGKTPPLPAERALRACKALCGRGAVEPATRLLAAVETARGAGFSADEKKDALKLRARLAVAAGAGEQEARVLQEIVALDPLDGEALLLLGQHSQRAGDGEKAAFWFERAAALERFEADAKVRLAQLLVGQRKYAEALPLLRRAQTLKPRDHVQQYLEQVERVAQAR